jgi:hypothetical protein
LYSVDPKDSEAELIALIGISHCNLTRWRQEGLIEPFEMRRERGYGRGTTPLRYSSVEVSKVNRLKELRRSSGRLASRGGICGSTAIAFGSPPTLLMLKIKTLDDVKTAISDSIWKPTDMPDQPPETG